MTETNISGVTSSPIKPKDPAIAAAMPKDREVTEVSRLRRVLEKSMSTPNTMKLADFNRFSILFKYHGDRDQMAEVPNLNAKIEKLTHEYLRIVDVYKPTNVVAPDGSVVFVIPPLFVELLPLSPTPENDAAVMANRKYMGSNIPKYQIEALAKLSQALNKQLTAPDWKDSARKTRQETIAILDNFKEAKKTGKFKLPNLQPVAAPPVEQESVDKSSPMSQPTMSSVLGGGLEDL